jgi:hypothetical protein
MSDSHMICIPEDIREILSLDTKLTDWSARISEYLKSDFDYEDRLHVWLNTPEQLHTIRSWVFHPTKHDKKYGEISWYDDFYSSKYEDVDLVEIFTKNSKEWDEERLKIFAQDCMTAGIHGFNYDW